MTNILNTVNIVGMGAIIINNVDEKLRNDFKSACYKRGVPMRTVILRLMELELDNNFSCLIDREIEKEGKES